MDKNSSGTHLHPKLVPDFSDTPNLQYN